MTIKDDIIADLEKLTHAELCQVYKYIRRYVIADIPGLKKESVFDSFYDSEEAKEYYRKAVLFDEGEIKWMKEK